MSEALKPILSRLVSGADLDEAAAEATLGLVMDGEATDAQMGALLTALRLKGETVGELTGAVRAMRARMSRLAVAGETILDTCGTGGDGAGTFNISTAVAFVCHAAGVTIAKHGNRAISSRVGSADVLEALGVNVSLDAGQVAVCVDRIGIGFMFAPSHHSALRFAGPARRQLGFRTMLNLLGPMTNPAGATHQLIGVFDARWLTPVAQVLGRLGTRRALIVHGSDGLDELTITGPSTAAFLADGKVDERHVDPRSVGVRLSSLETIAGGSAEENAAIIRDVLRGTEGPAADIVRLNAGAALWVAELAEDLSGGVALATEVLASGRAFASLQKLGETTRALAAALAAD